MRTNSIKTLNDVIVVENYVDHQCMRHLHLMCNSRDSLLFAQRMGGGEIKQGNGIHYYVAKYPYRGVLDMAVAVSDHKHFRRLVVWNLDGYSSMRKAIQDASTHFWTSFKFKPGYIFIKKLPKGIEHAQEYEEMILLEADWMPSKCIAVGGSL